MRNSLTKGLTVVVFACAAVTAQAVPMYTITDLGTLGGSHSYGSGVNDNGQATGWSYAAAGSVFPWHAFVGDASGLTSLGTLGGGGGVSIGWDINNSGLVTGQSNSSTGTHAFVGDASGLSDLGTLGGTNSSGNGINDSGQVAGSSSTSTTVDITHAFVGDASGLSDLGTLGGTNSYGEGINNSGQVAGSSQTLGDTATHAFVGDASGLTDLGTLGGIDSFGHDINDSGQVTGDSDTTSGIRHAFVGDASGLTDLGSLGGSSIGLGINNSGQVVGQSGTVIAGGTVLHAFLYDPVDGMLDLNDLVTDLTGWDFLNVAYDISDTGFIAGVGLTTNSVNHAFLLTPVSTQLSLQQVPVPTPLALLGIGLTLLGWQRHKAG